MRVAADRALHVVRAATEFDWTWTAEDLSSFAGLVGWSIAGGAGVGAPHLTTDFDIDRPDVMVSLGDPGPTGVAALEEMTFWVTDLDGERGESAAAAAFVSLATRVADVVGAAPHFSWTEPTRGLRWDLPRVVVTLTANAESVYIDLTSPDYQLWYDEIDRSLEND
ncbi:DUF6301 family protein [Nocardia shimofusensis]|uniref:DUF6301 family protein n=1 Tax=Nocardia shimofusensis TaxID=228596 RepID=UPI0008352DE3|nr:DUF6301 family protein [Nocardia shimofusensis]